MEETLLNEAAATHFIDKYQTFFGPHNIQSVALESDVVDVTSAVFPFSFQVPFMIIYDVVFLFNLFLSFMFCSFFPLLNLLNSEPEAL